MHLFLPANPPSQTPTDWGIRGGKDDDADENDEITLYENQNPLMKK